MERLGVDRVVLARENTIEDVRAIRAAVPTLGLETFVHGALCISYSGQCFMSGMMLRAQRQPRLLCAVLSQGLRAARCRER